MKLLFVLTPAFNPNDGGVQRTTFKLGKYFSEQGIEVFYFSTAHVGHIQAEYGTLLYSEEEGGQDNLNNITFLEQTLARIQPHVVINQMPYEVNLRKALYKGKMMHQYVLLGCLRNSLFNLRNNARDRMEQMLPKFVFKMTNNFIGIGIVKCRHWFRHRRELKSIIDMHDRFILLAPPNREELVHFVGRYKQEKVIAISNSIPEIHHHSITKKEKIIIHVGRLNIAQKRSDLLLDYWEKVHEKIPDWTFIIVGEGPYRKKMEIDLIKRNLPRIKLIGYHKPEPYYEKAAIFMMPSAYEGFPNTLLEAQSHGCIPQAFDSYSALGWIVNNNKDVLLSPPFDTQHMADQLVQLINSPVQLQKMALGALENAKRFTIDKVGQQWLELFNNLKIEE